MRLNYLLCLSMLCSSQAQAFKLPDQEISAYTCHEACPDLSHEPIHYEWSIADNKLAHQKPLMQKSYGYQKQVTLAQLQKGIEFNTLAPQAVIRISSLSGKTIPNLSIMAPNQQLLQLKEASMLLNENEAFGSPSFGKQPQTVSQLKKELGAGTFKLSSSDKNLTGNDIFILSVFDKFSSVYLSIETNKPEYKINEQLIATISLHDVVDYPIERVDAYIKTPQGDKYPLSLTKVSNSKYQGRAFMTSDKNELGENWYIDAEIKAWIGDQTVTRSGHTAFSYQIPSAKIVDIRKTTNSPLKLSATIEVANPSRYSLQAVLYYKDEQGNMHPVSTSQTANWFETGVNQLEFVLDKAAAAKYDESSLYVGYLHLTDYGQLKTVYHYDTPIKLSELG